MFGSGKSPRPARATTTTNLFLRVALGGYLLYLVWELRAHLGEPLYTVALGVFALAGIGLILWSIQRLLKGDYDIVDKDGNILEEPSGEEPPEQ